MKKIDGKELKKKIQAKSRLVDIDSPDEFKRSHIANSINIPYNEKDFVSKMKKTAPSHSDEVVLCSKPNNSKQAYSAGEKLEKEGYKNVYAHTLGQTDWKKSGVEIVEFR